MIRTRLVTFLEWAIDALTINKTSAEKELSEVDALAERLFNRLEQDRLVQEGLAQRDGVLPHPTEIRSEEVRFSTLVRLVHDQRFAEHEHRLKSAGWDIMFAARFSFSDEYMIRELRRLNARNGIPTHQIKRCVLTYWLHPTHQQETRRPTGLRPVL